MTVDQKQVLATLVARLVEAKAGDGWFVDGRITNEERAALIAASSSAPLTETGGEMVTEVIAVTINQTLCKSKKPASTAILCVDFGTAASKAAVSRSGNSIPEQLDLGIRAGEPAQKPWVSSTIGVDDAGMIVFGPAAERCARRIASIKSRLWDESDAIGDELLRADGHVFTGAGCLVGYLAYLTRLITNELIERKLPPYLPRRYAMPFAGDPGREALRKRFAGWLGQGQLLADTLGDRLLTGVAPAELRGALNALGNLRAPDWFIRTDPACIGEPVAAGSFAFSADVADRAVYMIVDIGAGTSDFCILAVKNRSDGDTEVYRAPGSDYSIEVAADEVDRAFHDYIRDEMAIGIDGSEATDLERNRRAWKEQMFTAGILDVSVGDDSIPLLVTLADFIGSPHWQGIERKLQHAQNTCFKGIDKGWIKQLYAAYKVSLRSGPP